MAEDRPSGASLVAHLVGEDGHPEGRVPSLKFSLSKGGEGVVATAVPYEGPAPGAPPAPREFSRERIPDPYEGGETVPFLEAVAGLEGKLPHLFPRERRRGAKGEDGGAEAAREGVKEEGEKEEEPERKRMRVAEASTAGPPGRRGRSGGVLEGEANAGEEDARATAEATVKVEGEGRRGKGGATIKVEGALDRRAEFPEIERLRRMVRDSAEALESWGDSAPESLRKLAAEVRADLVAKVMEVPARRLLDPAGLESLKKHLEGQREVEEAIVKNAHLFANIEASLSGGVAISPEEGAGGAPASSSTAGAVKAEPAGARGGAAASVQGAPKPVYPLKWELSWTQGVDEGPAGADTVGAVNAAEDAGDPTGWNSDGPLKAAPVLLASSNARRPRDLAESLADAVLKGGSWSQRELVVSALKSLSKGEVDKEIAELEAIQKALDAGELDLDRGNWQRPMQRDDVLFSEWQSEVPGASKTDLFTALGRPPPPPGPGEAGKSDDARRFGADPRPAEIPRLAHYAQYDPKNVEDVRRLKKELDALKELPTDWSTVLEASLRGNAVRDGIPESALPPRFVEDYNRVRCEGCKKAKDDKRMLLCDRCDSGWHVYCLSPPLTAVPSGDWFCSACAGLEAAANSDE